MTRPKPDGPQGTQQDRGACPADTSPEAFEVQVRLLRAMTAQQKLQRVSELNDTVRELAMAGLRRRYPEADGRELLRRYAALVLDRETVIRVYGWDPEGEER